MNATKSDPHNVGNAIVAYGNSSSLATTVLHRSYSVSVQREQNVLHPCAVGTGNLRRDLQQETCGCRPSCEIQQSRSACVRGLPLNGTSAHRWPFQCALWTVPFRYPAELIENMDDNLFQRILRDKNHILHALLPDRRRSLEYELRPRSHDRELVPKVNSLTESNFLIRQLYKNCYYQCYTSVISCLLTVLHIVVACCVLKTSY